MTLRLASLAQGDGCTAAEFVQRVIGLPWRENGYGPDAYDCWGLARACQREVFGRDLPVIDYPSTLRAIVRMMEDHTVRDAWPETKLPTHGDIVTMTAALHPHHIGTWLQLEGGRILHATEREGVMCSSLHHIRLEGFRSLRFHRYSSPVHGGCVAEGDGGGAPPSALRATPPASEGRK